MSCSDITVQRLAEYVAHIARGGKGNLGNEKIANHCAKLGVEMTGKKHTLETHAKMMSKAQTGRKHTLEALGKKHTHETCTKMSETTKSKKQPTETCAKISVNFNF